MQVVFAFMFIAGAGLQTAALVRYLARAQKSLRRAETVAAERGTPRKSYGDVQATMDDAVAPLKAQRRDFRIDVALIGSGAALSAVASVLSLGS